MNKNEWETRVQAAKPLDDEIAPLTPEASSRILFAALRENRRRKATVWFAAPFRVAVSTMAVAAVAYCFLPYVSTSEMPMVQKSVETSVSSPVATQLTAKDASASPVVKGSPNRNSLPKLPSNLPKPVKPQVMLARNSTGASSTLSGGVRGGRLLLPSTALVVKPRTVIASDSSQAGNRTKTNPAQNANRPPQDMVPDEGNMYVSVAGDSVLPPETETETEDTLTVTVHRDVPETVTGRAEAAALHSVPMPSATPNPADAQTIPVWTHVCVETGEEPVLTLTALR